MSQMPHDWAASGDQGHMSRRQTSTIPDRGAADPSAKRGPGTGSSDCSDAAAEDLIISMASGVQGISADVWDRLATGPDPAANPFLTHRFLGALERSGSAADRTGWVPRPVLLHQGARMIGAAPAYLKLHSWGEYVFDHSWADAWERAGGRYYPKLQCAVPFTPATGPRLLTAPDADRDQAAHMLIRGLEAVVDQNELSSAHATFLIDRDLQAFRDAGWLIRTGLQFHWHNDGYRDFDDFLDALSSRKRKAIRKERKAVADAGIRLEWLTGDRLQPEHWRTFYRFYRNTTDRKWGEAYLQEAFFADMGMALKDQVLLVAAFDRDDRMIAAALNLIGHNTLYGRNWGCDVDVPFLHFEACYYQAIAFAISRGLQVVEAGAQGHHKVQRGYRPTRTHSAHYIPHDGFRAAIADFLDDETAAMDAELTHMAAESPFRKDGKDG